MEKFIITPTEITKSIGNTEENNDSDNKQD